MKVNAARQIRKRLAACFVVGMSVRTLAQPAPPSAPVTSPPVKATIPPAAQKAIQQYQRAVTLHRAKKVEAAIAAYRQFLKLAEGAGIATQAKALAHQNLASLYFAKGDRKAQENALRLAVKLDPKNGLALSQLAGVLAEKKKYAEAKQIALKTLQLKPPPPIAAPAHFALGTVAIAANDSATAEKEYGLAAKLAPENPQAHFNYALALGRNKKWKPALEAALQAKTLAPNMVPVYLFVAAARLELKDIPGALEAYEATLKMEPRNPTALYSRAALLQQLGENEEAISAFLEFVQIKPKDAAGRANLGKLYYAIGNYTAAKLHFGMAAKLAPKDARVLASLALNETLEAASLRDPNQQKAGFAAAETHFQQAMKLDPKDKVIQDGIAILYERMGRYEEGMALFRKRIAENPDQVSGYQQLARLYVMQRKVDDVLATWKEYRKRKPDDMESYIQSAHVLEGSARYEEANAEWKLWLARHPKDGTAMLSIAQNLALMKKNPEAEAEFKAILDLDTTGRDVKDPNEKPAAIATAESNRLEALRGLAQLKQVEGKWDDAILWWIQAKTQEGSIGARSRKPAGPATYRALAVAYEKAKKPELAVKEYLALAQAYPNDPTPFADLARLYEGEEKIEEAADAYRKGAERSSDPTDYGVQVAELYRRKSKLDKALIEYEALAKRKPKDLRILSPIAQLYEQTRQDEKALAAYEALIKADPNARWAEGKKAFVLTRLKRYPEARAIYEKAIERNPDDYQAYADLARLYSEEGKPEAYLPYLQSRFEKAPHRRSLMAAVLDQFTQQKNEDAGLVYLRGVVEKHAKERVILEGFASLLLQRKRVPEAVAIYKRIADENPKDVGAQVQYAQYLDLNGQRDEATKLFETLVARTDLPADQIRTVRIQLATRYVQLNRQEDAITQYRAVVKAFPEDFVSASTLAGLLATTGREDEAIPLYAGMLGQTAYPAPVRAQIRVRLGDIYAKKGNKTEAAGHYREALKLNPNDEAAKEGLKKVEAM